MRVFLLLCLVFCLAFLCKGQTQYEGVASYYGEQFHGKQTASGQTFNQHALTAAHPTLPFGTKIRVTNIANNNSVVVTVNDRGPYAKDRIIDLSYEAARILGYVQRGLTYVKLEIIK